MKRVCWAMAIFLSAQASAIEVIETVWGFDGQVMAGRLNLFSVLVTNPSADAFEGTMSFYKSSPLGQMGAEYVQKVYVAPQSSRWVQFYPYVGESGEEWLLVWGRGDKQRAKIAAARAGEPAAVLLTDPENVFRRPTSLKVFSDNLFPPTVTATDGLAAVALDYAPRWAPAQREAFMDWLWRGGRLHLLRDEKGKYPQFHEDLAELNTPVEKTRIGAGEVVRHALTRREASAGALWPQRVAIGGDETSTNPRNYQEQIFLTSPEDLFRTHLGKMSRPKHNWTLIYLLNLVYLVLIGPVNYLLGRRWRDYRLTILFFLCSVALFGAMFTFVGRQGHGSHSTAHTLAYARNLGNGKHDVTQWINIFVNRGADYTITHASAHNLYATGHDYEAVRGQIVSGKDGQFVVDIPIYSSRAFLHRGKMSAPDMKLTLTKWDPKSPAGFELNVAESFPSQPIEMWAFHGDRFYRLTLADGRLYPSGSGEAVSSFLSQQKLQLYDYQTGFVQTEITDPAPVFQKFVPILIARTLGIEGGAVQKSKIESLTSDRLQIFIFTRAPDSFRLKTHGAVRETGYVLYHQEIAP